MQIANFQHHASTHWETGNLRNALMHEGIAAPHTGAPFSEAMLLGIGGGLGGGYFLCKCAGMRVLQVYGRHLAINMTGDFLKNIVTRLAIPFTSKEAGGSRAAVANLYAGLGAGHPVIAYVSLGQLPYHFLHERYRQMIMYSVLVHGFDEAADNALVSDRGAMSMTMGAGTLTEARAGICTHKSRTLFLNGRARVADLKPALTAGLRDCWRGLLQPSMGSLGISGFEKWADLIANVKNKDGWPKALPTGAHLHESLRWNYYWIETGGTGGGNFRALYADFLDEAAGVVGEKGLREIAGRYRELAGMWSAFAEASLPGAVKPFKKTRDLLVKMHDLFQEKGARGLKEMEKASAQLAAISVDLEKHCPLDAPATLALLEDLRDRLMRIIVAEKQAAGELQRLAG